MPIVNFVLPFTIGVSHLGPLDEGEGAICAHFWGPLQGGQHGNTMLVGWWLMYY